MKGSDIIKGLPGAEDVPNLAGMVDAALEVCERRRDTLRRLKDALINEDTDKALSLARQLCGLEDMKTDA